MWNCTKHTRPHLSSQGNWRKWVTVNQSVGENQKEKTGDKDHLILFSGDEDHKPTLGPGSLPSWAHVGQTQRNSKNLKN